MLRFRATVVALAASLAALACAPVRTGARFPSGPVAAPRWRASFERGDLSEWTYLLNPRGLSVVDTLAADGKRAGRVEIQARDLWPNGLNRVEVQHKPPPETMTEGQRSCFAWKLLVPEALSDDRHQIGYWESYPSYRQIMSFEVRGQAIAFVTHLPAEQVQWRAAGVVTPAVWHQLAMCARWSAFWKSAPTQVSASRFVRFLPKTSTVRALTSTPSDASRRP